MSRQPETFQKVCRFYRKSSKDWQLSGKDWAVASKPEYFLFKNRTFQKVDCQKRYKYIKESLRGHKMSWIALIIYKWIRAVVVTLWCWDKKGRVLLSNCKKLDFPRCQKQTQCSSSYFLKGGIGWLLVLPSCQRPSFQDCEFWNIFRALFTSLTAEPTQICQRQLLVPAPNTLILQTRP